MSRGKSTNPYYFLTKSVNPPLFSFKSKSALFETLCFIASLQLTIDVVFMTILKEISFHC